MSPHCDPEREDRNKILLYDTLAHDVASPYQVCLQKVQQLRRYHPDEHSLDYWTSSVTSTTTEQSNLFTTQSTLWWCTIKPSLDAKGSAVQIIYWKDIFWSYYPKLWLWPWKLQTNLFLKGNLAHNDASLLFCDSEDIIQTFTDILNLRCDLIPFFSTGQSVLRCCTIKPSLVANRPAV